MFPQIISAKSIIQWKVLHFDANFTHISKGPFNNKPQLVQITAWSIGPILAGSGTTWCVCTCCRVNFTCIFQYHFPGTRATNPPSAREISLDNVGYCYTSSKARYCIQNNRNKNKTGYICYGVYCSFEYYNYYSVITEIKIIISRHNLRCEHIIVNTIIVIIVIMISIIIIHQSYSLFWHYHRHHPVIVIVILIIIIIIGYLLSFISSLLLSLS